MKEHLEKPDQGMVCWKQEELTKKLCGEQVLEISLSWPELSKKTLVGANRYYFRLRNGWKRQWERDVYISACIDLAEKRAQSRPFKPWKVSLKGRVMLEHEDMLSIAMEARELHGDGRTLVCAWGDTWRVKDGMPVELKELLPKSRQWKKQMKQSVLTALEGCVQRGIYLDGMTMSTWKKCIQPGKFAITEEHILLFVPQCTIAPAVEGVVELFIPRHRE
jgi:hypothetical protein